MFVGQLPQWSLRVHDASTGVQIALRQGPQFEQHHLVVSPDSTVVATAGAAGVVRLFSLPDLEPIIEI